MKRIICILLVFSMLLLLVGCGSEPETTPTGDSNTTNKTENNQISDNEVDYLAVDSYNNIYMYMYGDKYSYTKIGNVWDLYDGDTVVTYAHRPSFEESTSIKDIFAFYDYIPNYFDSILSTNKQKYDFKKLGEKTINGIIFREFEGTIIDDSDKSHPSKAYTFNYNSEDIIVIAVSMENNNAMKNKMEKDLEYFMTHLKFGE